jgi:branched-chain amino acid transport system ATP-binding protein
MILLDEPSEGIMPVLVDEMFELFARMKAAPAPPSCWWSRTSSARCRSPTAPTSSTRAASCTGTAADLLADADIQNRYCAV